MPLKLLTFFFFGIWHLMGKLIVIADLIRIWVASTDCFSEKS